MGIRRGSKDPEPLLDRIAPFLCTRVNLTWTMNPIFRIVSHFQPVRDPTRQPTQCEHHREHLGHMTDSLGAILGAEAMLGITCGGVLGGVQELEDGPGLSVWAASMPGVTIRPFR
mgnify:CR=1 FL=1